MDKAVYIRQLKRLIKKYHPDLCKDEYLEKEYNEITVKLTNKLNRIKNGIEESTVMGAGQSRNSEKSNLPVKAADQGYLYYKLGIKFYRNIHPNQFYKRNTDKTYVPKTYEEQVKILNDMYVSFSSAGYYFRKVVNEYPESEWAADSGEKIKLLKLLHKSYEDIDTEKYNRILDANRFVNEMGIRIM